MASTRTPKTGAGRFAPARGRQAELGASMTFDSVPDGVRPALPGTADPVARRDDGTVTSAGAEVLARMRWEAAKNPDFAERELECVPTEEFAPFDAARRDLLRVERQQLHEIHGVVPAAVGTTLRGAAWLTAFAEYWAVQAAKSGDPDAAERAARLFKSASMERAKAWEMARAAAASHPSSRKNPILDAIEAAGRAASEGNNR